MLDGKSPSVIIKKNIGRPVGTSNVGARQPSGLSKAFRQSGLNWQKDFAKAILENNKERMQFWIRMMPQMYTLAGIRRPTGREHGAAGASRTSKEALETLKRMEGRQQDE